MDNSFGYPNAPAPSSKATIHALIDAMRGWRDSLRDLVFLTIKRKLDLLFCVTRQQLGLTSVSTPGHVNDTPAELELARERVAAAAAAITFFGIRRSAKPQDPFPRPMAHGNVASVLKAAQMLLQLLGAMGAANAAFKRNKGAALPVLLQPQSVVQKPASVAPWTAMPRGNWFSQQSHMINADSFVVLITWVYYSAQIFLFGAEYKWAYANRQGSLEPAQIAGDKPSVSNRHLHLNRSVVE